MSIPPFFPTPSETSGYPFPSAYPNATPSVGGVVVGGDLIGNTLQNTPNVGTIVRTTAFQERQRRGGNVGVATSVDTSSSFPYGQIEACLGDSIGLAVGSSSFGKTDWPSILANQENRLLGLPDAGLGYTDTAGGGGVYSTPQFSAIGASLTQVLGLHPEQGNAGITAVQLTGTINSSTATNSLTDNRVFNRALIFFKPVTNGDGIGVSITGGGGSVFATIDPNASATTPLHGNTTVDFYDTGVISSPSTAPTLSLTRRTAVTGAGGVAPTVYGVLYYAPGVAGTSGLSIFNIASGGTTTADWLNVRTWESALAALGRSIRRVHVLLGCNDFLLARQVGDAAYNNSTTLTSSTAVFTPGDVGRTVTGPNIPAGATIAGYTSSTTITLSASTVGGSFTNQQVTFGPIPPSVTQSNLTTIIQRIRAVLPYAEIAFFGEYQPGLVPLSTANVYTPSYYLSTIVPVYQTVAYANNCSYVDMFSRFGSTQNRAFSDATYSSGSSVINSASGASFCALDVGSKITGVGIPANTVIGSVTSATQANLSTAGGSAVTTTSTNGAAASITAVSASGGTVTFTTTTQSPAFTPGQQILLSGMSGGFGVLNGATVTVLASGLTTTQFTITSGATGSSTTGTASPATVINADVYGLSMDGGLHFGDYTNSAGSVDGQRAIADEVWERLGYAKSIPAPIAGQGLVTLTSGTNWICPATGTYLVTCVGGGGQGGGGGSTTTASGTATGGGGGGSGASATGILSLTGGTLYPYTVAATISAAGNGGAAGGTNAGTNGSNGNNTTFGSGPLVSAAGGGGGQGGATSNASIQLLGGAYGQGQATTGIGAGIGGVANLTTFNLPLGGGSPLLGGGGAGGGGGNGGATNKGGTGGGAGTAIAGGTAGTNAGSGTAAGTAGGAATAYGAGGGGGGGGNNSLAGGAGGAGAGGVIYLQKVG
jgi:hypothetical protein